MFEAALASASAMLSTQPAGCLTELEGISIAAPMALGPRSGSILEVSLVPAAGSLTVYSLTGAAAQRQLHLRATAAAAVTEVLAASAATEPIASPEQAVQAYDQLTAAVSQMSSQSVAALLGSAVDQLHRFNGGAVAALDAAQALPGSGYTLHPAIADACLHTGAVFVPVPPSAADEEADAPARGSATVPVAVAALAAPSTAAGVADTRSEMYGTMGAARLLRSGTSFCDFRMRSAATEAGTIMALAQLQGRPVGVAAQAQQPMTAAQAVEAMLYTVEWRVSDVGASEGSLSMVLPTEPQTAEWAAVPKTGLLRRFRLPRSRMATTLQLQSRGPASQRAGAQPAEVAAGNLAVVQELLRMPFAAGQRLQLNTAGPLPDGMAPIDGLPAGAMAAASAAAVLKVQRSAREHPEPPRSTRSQCCIACTSLSSRLYHPCVRRPPSLGSQLRSSRLDAPNMASNWIRCHVMCADGGSRAADDAVGGVQCGRWRSSTLARDEL